MVPVSGLMILDQCCHLLQLALAPCGSLRHGLVERICILFDRLGWSLLGRRGNGGKSLQTPPNASLQPNIQYRKFAVLQSNMQKR